LPILDGALGLLEETAADGQTIHEVLGDDVEGNVAGRGVLEFIGHDVAAFCDDLIKDSRTYADIYQESIRREPGTTEK
jgi:DNA-binding ferritin-like protein (Dps family)